MDTSSNEKHRGGTSLDREVPRPLVIGALVVTVLASVAIAWLQVRRGSRPTVDDLQARWVALADSVQDLRSRGRHAEALLAAAQSVALAEQAYGPDHPATAEALGELASLRVAAADLDGTDELLHRAADIQAGVTGPDSPEVAGTLNSLAQLFEKRGEFHSARKVYDRTLAIYRKALGDDHALTARALNNIACLEDARGNHDEAERLHREAVGIREHLLGPAHLDTAESYGNLAANARSRGDLETAETFQRRALAIRERSAGMNHPLTAASLAGLANVLRETRRLDEADLLGLAALAIRQDTYGFRHPTTASSLETLASIRADQGDAAAARALLEKSLVIRRGKTPGHPATAKTLEQVALLTPPADESPEQAAARRTRAIDLLDEAVAIRSASLGSAHADTLTAMKHLSEACDRAGLPDRSRQVAKRMSDLIAADGGSDAPTGAAESSGKPVAETVGQPAAVAE